MLLPGITSQPGSHWGQDTTLRNRLRNQPNPVRSIAPTVYNDCIVYNACDAHAALLPTSRRVDRLRDGRGLDAERGGVDPDRTKEIFRMQTITYGRHEWRRRCQFYAHRTTRQRRPAFLRFRLCRCCTDTDRTLCTTDPDSGATTGPRIDFLPTLSLHNYSQLHSSILQARCGLVLKLLHLSLPCQAHLTVALNKVALKTD